jgi:hypothetical protein
MQDNLIDHERRISTLEGAAFESRATLSSIDSRLNTLDQRLTYMWVSGIGTTVAAFAALFVAIFLRS